MPTSESKLFDCYNSTTFHHNFLKYGQLYQSRQMLYASFHSIRTGCLGFMMYTIFGLYSEKDSCHQYSSGIAIGVQAPPSKILAITTGQKFKNLDIFGYYLTVIYHLRA